MSSPNTDMHAEPTGMPGCIQLYPRVFRDRRGCFVKTFHEEAFVSRQLAGHFAEDYYSVSRRNVLRGLHFQCPPYDYAKVVYCIDGTVADVIVDLRRGSPTEGEHRLITLSARLRNVLYIPSGVAHGFCVLSTRATVMYKTTVVHSPAHDSGVRWDSCGIAWPISDPILSDRDRSLQPLREFRSPFVFDAAAVADR